MLSVGPISAVVTLLVAQGLADQGCKKYAAKIADDTRALIEKAGFSFCPLTGAGAGGADFSRTAAIWL